MTKYKPVIEMITALGFAFGTLMLLFMAAIASDGIEGIWMVVAAFAELGLLIGCVILIYRYFQHRAGRTLLAVADQEGMKVKRSMGDDGELVILGYDPGTSLFTFQGKGNQVMDQPIYLTASLYLLKYDCPPPASLKIEMVDVAQDAIISVMDITGTGSQTFSVESDGQYVFQVTYDALYHHKKWRVECIQM
jgi:hypothetical protein